MGRDHVGGYGVSFGDEVYLVLIDKARSDREWGVRPSCKQEAHDIFEVFRPFFSTTSYAS